jgi:hypothetical protein
MLISIGRGKIMSDEEGRGLNQEEVHYLQVAMLEKYRGIATEQNRTVKMFFRLGIPFTEAQRMVQGCACTEVKDCFNAQTETQPVVQGVGIHSGMERKLWDEIVPFIRKWDSDRAAYGNSPHTLDTLWEYFLNYRSSQKPADEPMPQYEDPNKDVPQIHPECVE